MSDPTSAGEVGGIFAGIVAVLVALGHGLRWWLGWTDRKAATRSAKLGAWQKELDLREARLDAEQAAINDEIRAEIATLKEEAAQREVRRQREIATLKEEAAQREVRRQREIAALLGGYQLVAAELHTIKPESDALRRADELLHSVFPFDPTTPAGMVVLLSQVPEPKDGETGGDA